MSECQVVVLYGGSLLLAGLETCLQGLAGLCVMRVGGARNGAARQLQSLKPAAVIFDGEDHDTDWPVLVQLLENSPHTLVIGLDAARSDLMILSGQKHAANDLSDVIAALRQRMSTG